MARLSKRQLSKRSKVAEAIKRDNPGISDAKKFKFATAQVKKKKKQKRTRTTMVRG